MFSRNSQKKTHAFADQEEVFIVGQICSGKTEHAKKLIAESLGCGMSVIELDHAIEFHRIEFLRPLLEIEAV